MVEQRPFKALVVGSSPTQPTVVRLRKVDGAAIEAHPQAVEYNSTEKFHTVVCCYLLRFFLVTLAELTFLTAD